MLNKRNILSTVPYLLSSKTPWRLALILTSISFLVIVAATFVHPPWVSSQGAGPTVTLVGPPHDTWINTNPTFTARVSSPGSGSLQNYFAFFNSIAVQDDAPRFAYLDDDGTDKNILFARCTDRTCSTIFRNPIENGPDQSTYPKIALDNNGYAMISYSVSDGSGNYRIMYAHCTDIDCANLPTITTVATLISQPSWPSPVIARGTDGTARIAYHTKTTDEILIIRCNNLDCTNRTGPNAAYQFGGGSKPDLVRLSMEVNNNNLPRIASTSDNRLQIIFCSDADCSSATSRRLNNKAASNLYISMALNYSGCAEGCPQITFRAGPSDFYFASCNNSTCSSSSVNILLSMYNAFAPSVQVHSSGTPRFTFHARGGGGAIDTGLMYVRCTNADCTTNSPDPPNKVTNFQTNWPVIESSIALDSNGFALISTYYPHSSDGAFNDRGAELGYFYCNDDPCSSPTWASIDKKGIGGDGPDVWAEFNWQCPAGYTCSGPGATNPTPPVDTIGSIVSGGGPGNSTHTWSPDLDDGIYDWRAKAIDSTSAESLFTSPWIVKKDTLEPQVTCSVSSTGENITVQHDTLDRIPSPVGPPSGSASGDLQEDTDGGGWNTVSTSATGPFNKTGTIGETYSYRFKGIDNAGNTSGGDTYSNCGSTILSEPGWVETNDGDVGALGAINMSFSPSGATIPASDEGNFPSIATGTDGFPVIVYAKPDGSDYDLMFIKCGSADCSSGNKKTTLETSGDVGRDNSIAIGSDGYPVISYGDVFGFDASLNTLNFIKCGGADCSSGNITTTVDSNRVGRGNSIAIGDDGYPVISYVGNTSNLKFAKCTGDGGDADSIPCSATGEWVTTVASSEAAGAVNTGRDSIAIGSDGFPVISYKITGDYDLKFAKCTGDGGDADSIPCSATGEWVVTTVDSTGNVGSYNSMAIGTDGFPVISYMYSDASDLKFAKCTGDGGDADSIPCSATGEWVVTTVDSTGNVGYEASIAIGDDSYPVISHARLSGAEYDLKFAKCTGDGGDADSIPCSATSEWTNVTIDSPDDMGLWSSLAIGGDSYPVIGYHDITNADLRVAKQTPGTGTGCTGDVNSDWTCNAAAGAATTGPPIPNTNYLVIANNTITNFNSVKGWLVWPYSTDDGINTGFTADNEFEELWKEFGSSQATDWPQTEDGNIPNNLGIYAYPSKDAINTDDTVPPQDFKWDGTGALPCCEQVVLYINGNLDIDANLTLGNKKVVFIVRNNITVDPTVTQIDGFYVSGGAFNSGTIVGGSPPENLVAIGRDSSPRTISRYINGTWDAPKSLLGITANHPRIIPITDQLWFATNDDDGNELVGMSAGLRTKDGGETWEATPEPAWIAGSGAKHFAADAGGRLWMISHGTTTYTQTQIWYSEDKGNTWTLNETLGNGLGGANYDIYQGWKLLPHPTNQNIIAVIGHNPRYSGLGGDTGFMAHTLDRGETSWTVYHKDEYRSGQSSVTYTRDAAMLPTGRIVAVGQLGYVYPHWANYTDDYGANVVGVWSDLASEARTVGPFVSSDGTRVAFLYSPNLQGNPTTLMLSTDSGESYVATTLPAFLGGNPGNLSRFAYSSINDAIYLAHGAGGSGVKVVKLSPVTEEGVWTDLTDAYPHSNDGNHQNIAWVPLPSTSSADSPLVVDGAVISFSDPNLRRDLGALNPTTPAEVFNYDPSYLYLFAEIDDTLRYSLLGNTNKKFTELPP